MQRQLNIDENLHEFLGIKGRIRVLKDLEEREAKKREEERLNQEMELQEYQNTLQSIKELMEEEDVDKLEAMFVKQEEENFALFNYVNELNHEMETLTSSIETIKEQIGSILFLCLVMFLNYFFSFVVDVETKLKDTRENLQKNKVQVLEEELDQVTKEADEMEEMRTKADKDLEELLKGIEELYEMVNQDDSPMMHLLGKLTRKGKFIKYLLNNLSGKNTQITLYNVNMYLGLIEKNVNEIMTQACAVENLQAKE